MIEAVEVRTEDTIYLVKVSTKLASRLEKFDEDDIDDIVEPIDVIKGIDLDEDAPSEDDDEEEVDITKDPGGSEDGDDDDDDDDDADDIADDDDDDDEE